MSDSSTEAFREVADEALRLCSTTPAAALPLHDRGAIVTGGVADLVVLDRELAVRQTHVAGRLAYSTL